MCRRGDTMERYHMTKTLLESWQYTFDCFEGYEDSAHEDFLHTLNRQPLEPNEAMLNGLAFEDRVYRLANGGTVRSDAKWLAGAQALADIIRGAQIQVVARRDIEVDGMTFEVMGILDALKAGTIYDVKFINKSISGGEPPHLYGKYLNCSQHPAYFYIVPEAMEFQYLVSDGETIYIEAYQREQTRDIGEIIHEFLESIKGMGLLDLYKEKWLLP